MSSGSSELVRGVAYDKYVKPAIQTGRMTFSISVKDLMQALRPIGFPSNNYPQICTSIQGKKFVEGNHLRVVRTDGPPSGQSSTVVVHYQRLPESSFSQKPESCRAPLASMDVQENASAKAERLINSLRGLLKDEIAEFGGAEGYIRWVRGYDEEETQIPNEGMTKR